MSMPELPEVGVRAEPVETRVDARQPVSSKRCAHSGHRHDQQIKTAWVKRYRILHKKFI